MFEGLLISKQNPMHNYHFPHLCCFDITFLHSHGHNIDIVFLVAKTISIALNVTDSSR